MSQPEREHDEISEEIAVAKVEKKDTISYGQGVEISSLEELYRFSVAVQKSAMAPKSLRTPEQVMVAIQTGMEAGLGPINALRSVYVINGMPAWRGEAALGLIRNSGRCDYWKHGVDGEGEEMCAWVETKRNGETTVHRGTFSVADAKRAKLWGKAGPWSEHPGRMLKWRAIGHAASEMYGDVLMGLSIGENEYHADRSSTVVDTTPPDGPDPLLVAEIVEE